MACYEPDERRGPQPKIVYQNNPFGSFMVMSAVAMLLIAAFYNLGKWLWQLI